MRCLVIPGKAAGVVESANLPVPEPEGNQVLIHVDFCGVCHTELDELTGRCAPAFFPIIPGHQVVGRIEAKGPEVRDLETGLRVGVAWIFYACGSCEMCRRGLENLCPRFMGTGKDAHGGYAEYLVADAGFVYPIPDAVAGEKAAPLLCAGAIGYRSLKLSGIGDGQILGLSGFGASAHLVMQMVARDRPEVIVFVLARNPEERAFALDLGAAWAGDFHEKPPEKINAVIDTTPVWGTVIASLERLAPGGRLVINAIRKEDKDRSLLEKLNYVQHLWMEKQIQSVANVSRRDVSEFLQLAEKIKLDPEVKLYPLAEAGRALEELRGGGTRGAKVLEIG